MNIKMRNILLELVDMAIAFATVQTIGAIASVDMDYGLTAIIVVSIAALLFVRRKVLK